MSERRKTIAIDFDAVIHKYSKGWQDGSIYDEPVEGAMSSINLLCSLYNVFIFSTRNKNQIKKWLINHSNQLLYMSNSDFMDRHYPMTDISALLIEQEYNNNNILQWRVETIPFYKKFWNKQGVIGITKRKLPAHCYIDDRAIRFDGNWNKTLSDISFFKTYQNG